MLHPVTKRVATTVLAQHQVLADKANVLRPHDLISGAFLQNSVLMNPGLMSERVLSHNGLVSLHLHPGDRRHQVTGRIQPIGIHIRLTAVIVGPRFDRHHDLFQRGVARTFAQSVDRAFNLTSSGFDRRQTVGHGQSQIVVTVSTDDRTIDIRHILSEIRNHSVVVTGCGITHRIRDIDCRGTGRNGAFHHFAQEVEFCASRVFRREFNVVAKLLCLLDRPHRAFDNLVLVHLQLEFPMDGTGGQEHVDSSLFGVNQRFLRPLNIVVQTAGQSADGGPISISPCDFRDSFKVSGRSDRKSGFDHIHSQFHQRTSHLQLFAGVHAATGRLFAITQRGIKNDDPVTGHGSAS